MTTLTACFAYVPISGPCEVECDCMDLIHFAQDRDQWQALMTTVMNLQFPSNTKNFSTTWVSCQFCKKDSTCYSYLIKNTFFRQAPFPIFNRRYTQNSPWPPQSPVPHSPISSIPSVTAACYGTMKCMGQWMYRFTRSWRRYQMEIHYQHSGLCTLVHRVGVDAVSPSLWTVVSSAYASKTEVGKASLPEVLSTKHLTSFLVANYLTPLC
jgi:hypothetical protein